MRYFKQIIIALALTASSFQSDLYGCADFDPDGDYYNLFDQLLLKEKGLHPYLLTLYNGLYTTDEEIPDENISAWMAFFKKNNLFQGADPEQFEEFLYRTPMNNFYNPTYKYTAMLNKSAVGKEVLAYLQYAKEVEPYAQLATDNENRWETKRTKSPSEANYMILKNKGINLYKTCKQDELKLRYAYQLVRLAHYMRNKNKDAVAMFNLYVKPLKQEHYIYYAALEQVAGALYNLNNLANANYLYCQVFDHSDSRKEVAYNSIKIQDEVNWEETLALCTNTRTQAALYAIRGYNTFSNEMEEVENILNIYPESPYLRLLAIRYINKVERAVLASFSYSENQVFLQPSEELLEEYAHTKEIIGKIIENPQAGEKDFWAVYLAHLSFLCRDYEVAESTLSALQTSDPALLKQASRTHFCLYLTQLKGIGKQEETKIAEYLEADNTDVEFIKEVVGHLYKQQNDYGRAFLTHNQIADLQANPDLIIINSIISNSEKGNDRETLTQLYELKGTYFLRTGDLKEAMKWYDRVADSYHTFDSIYDYKNDTFVALRPDQFNGYSGISPLIFSNGFKRLFSVPAASQFTDQLYTRYDFLNQYHNKATLTQSLLKLEKESQKNTKEGIYATYLLANYYYNISPNSYYRNIPLYSSSNGNMSYYTNNNDHADIKFPDYSKDYNYKNFEYYPLVISYMSKALELYERVVENSSDRELRAQALFMASSCVMDLYAPNWYYNIKEGNDRSYGEQVNIYFHKLAANFNDTQFYQEAVRECKYFEYYVKNEF